MNLRPSFVGALFPLLLLNWVAGQGNNCTLNVSGTVTDEGSKEPLAYATLFLEESGVGVSTNERGEFSFSGVCSGEYHVLVRHVGCEPERLYLPLRGDTTLDITLRHYTELIDEVIVEGRADANTTQATVSLGEEEIAQGGDGNLGRLLANVSGVSVLGNGSTVSKPVIHGLYGNRIAVLNNGIAQAGQQWGNDHAPEIDPFVADNLSVIKGVGTLRYGAGTLGGVVMVEPAPPSEDPHYHGRVGYYYATNGRGHTLTTQIGKGGGWADWRFTGTLRRQGDQRAPNYWLRNTGRGEAAAALQVRKKLNANWTAETYLSHFGTRLGLLRSSHIGNLTDLADALNREIPFFTEPDFSYSIDLPRQQVNHQLLKAKLLHENTETAARWSFIYAIQRNERREFDIRRGGRSDMPVLSLLQWTHFAEIDHQRPLNKDRIFKAGLQTTLTNNRNQNETGVLPLIPDFNSYTPAAYVSLERPGEEKSGEIGARYDYVNHRVATISRALGNPIVRFAPDFHQFSVVAGRRYQLTPRLNVAGNVGLARRAPAVNELYSFGLHQGVSGIEEGDPELNPELSLKGTLKFEFTGNNGFFLRALAYYQRVDDYIYLQVQPDFRLTIRGAFPVYLYEQTDAEIAGLDLLNIIEPLPNLRWVTQISMLRGTDRSNDQPLVLMPPNRLDSRLEYSLPESKRFSNTTLSVNTRLVARQDRLNADQDLLPPPPAYALVGLSASTHILLGKRALHFNVRVDNLLNATYRDYLNRLRYFADEIGRNVMFGVNYEF